MKRRTLITIVLVHLALCVFAQNEHLSFKGVPIDGTLNHYVQEMRQKGFTLVKTGKSEAILRGDFAGIKGCEVGVYTLDAMDLVSNIGVIFPYQITWARLEGDYQSLKRNLTSKYGRPTECVEKFDNKYVDDDSDRMYALEFDKCHYYTIWSTELGDIELSLQRDESLRCYVFLKFFDRLNSNAVQDIIMEDL